MSSLRSILIIVTFVVVMAVLAIAAGVVWLNTFIHSEAFKTEVETRAGQSLGGTVKIGNVNFDIFNGVKLQGLATQIKPSHTSGRGALEVKIESVNCAYAWSELLNRRLKLTGVTLDKPQIVLTKQATAPMTSPETTPASAPSSATAGTPSGPVVNQAQGITMPFQFILDRAKINDGSVSVRDANGASMVELRGLNANANTSGYYEGKDVTGTLRVADMTFPPNLHVTDFSTPITYRQGGAVEAKAFEASAYGGTIAGDYEAGTTGTSVLDLNGKGLDVAQLAAVTTSSSTAKLDGSLDFQSKWRGIETGDLTGEGDAQLVNGKLTGVKILSDLSKIFRLKQLDTPIITQAKTHFLVQNRQTKFIGLQLDSPLFKITGDGVIGFNGGLDANLVLILTKDAMSELPTQVAASFVQQQDGTGSIAFRVTGTTSRPETDLATRLLMQNTQIKDTINKALNKFFH